MANEGTVTFNVLSFQIIEELSTLADSFYQPMAGMVIVGVGFEVFREMLDMFR